MLGCCTQDPEVRYQDHMYGSSIGRLAPFICSKSDPIQTQNQLFAGGKRERLGSIYRPLGIPFFCEIETPRRQMDLARDQERLLELVIVIPRIP